MPRFGRDYRFALSTKLLSSGDFYGSTIMKNTAAIEIKSNKKYSLRILSRSFSLIEVLRLLMRRARITAMKGKK